MKYLRIFIIYSALGFAASCWASDAPETPKIVRFPSGDLTLGGELFLPEGEGPFPVVLFNHGSAPKMINSMASAAIAPNFIEKGWAFFMPYRRGQGLSEDQGTYIMEEIRDAKWFLFESPEEKLVELHKKDHLDDQLAALEWLRTQPFVDKTRIATVGNSFGGIQVMLGMARADYCAGVNASGAAQSWADSKELRELLRSAATVARAPIFFFQAENDYDLSPSRELSSVMEQAGKKAKIQIYPKFGSSKNDGHSLPYRGVAVWFGDAIQFLDEHCEDEKLNKSMQPTAKASAD